MICLITGLQSAQDGYSFFYAGLRHINLLETSRQSMILLKNSTILTISSGADTFELASIEYWFEKIGGI